MKTTIHRILFLGLAALLIPLVVLPAQGQSFVPGAPLTTARGHHSATLLPNGKVLLAAGDNIGGFLASAELYDPATGTSQLTGSLHSARRYHTATLLSDGKVLVAGGSDATRTFSSAEVYDPLTGVWTVVAAMNTARKTHTATLLPNGQVLVAGGQNGSFLSSAELFDPATGSWTDAGVMQTARYNHTATLMPNGKVLVVAGNSGNTSDSYLSSAEQYDPATGLWTAVAGTLSTPRTGQTATLLPSGQLLAVAGFNALNGRLASAELYEPAAGSWRTSWLTTAREVHTATLLPNAKIVIIGGSPGGAKALSSVELYDPATGTWTASNLPAPRKYHTATLLPNGKVLVAGGYDGTNYLSSTLLYEPEPTAGIKLVVPTVQSGLAFQFAFAAAPTGTNTILSSTDPGLPVANWTVLGTASEFAPGLYLFTDQPTAQPGPASTASIRINNSCKTIPVPLTGRTDCPIIPE